MSLSLARVLLSNLSSDCRGGWRNGCSPSPSVGQVLEMSLYWHLLPGRTVVKQDEMEEGASLVASLGLGTILFHLYRKAL